MAGYNGVYCENMVPALGSGGVVTGYVADNAFNYYHFNAYSAYNMLIQVNQTNTGDCDLYVKADMNPSRLLYDYRDISFRANISLTVPNPSDRTWYIGVYGYQACSYLLSVSTSSVCPNGCSGHGTCMTSGSCACASGYSGSDCSIASMTISSGSIVSGTVAATSWVYYTFSAAASSITVSLKELNTTGGVWLYTNRNSYPTTLFYDNANTQVSAQHTIVFHPTMRTLQTSYYIGVYGGPMSSRLRPSAYELALWVTPF